jgi:MYXO-CTERM domain-containing protein
MRRTQNDNIGQLTLMFCHDGHWFLAGRGHTVRYASGHIPGFDGGAFHHVSLTYNAAANTASAALDGTPLVVGLALPYAPNIKYAGIEHAGTVNGVMDSFSVAPEPATLALPGLGALAVLRRRCTA